MIATDLYVLTNDTWYILPQGAEQIGPLQIGALKPRPFANWRPKTSALGKLAP